MGPNCKFLFLILSTLMVFISTCGSQTVTINPSGATLLELNENITLDCSIDGFNGTVISYQWTLDSEEVISNDTNSDITITYANASSTNQGGIYGCTVFTDTITKASINTILIVFAPIIDERPISVNTMINGSVTLRCNVASSPTSIIRWARLTDDLSINSMTTLSELEASFTNLPVNANQAIIEMTNTSNVSTLTINPVQSSDFGDYICVGILDNDTLTNPDGSGSGLSTQMISVVSIAISEIATISVSPNGTIKVNPLNQILQNGTVALFNCTAEGGPDNTFIWTRDSTSIIEELSMTNTDSINVTDVLDNFDSSILSTGNELLVSITSGNDSGGIYTCIAFNEAGFDSANVNLFVSLQFISTPEDVHLANEGTSAEFTCIADSFPLPTYQWQRWNASAKKFENIPRENRTTFIISPTTFDDFGTYRCVASELTKLNESINDTAILYISPNNSVSIDPPFISSDNGSEVTFNCSANGGPDNRFIWLRTEDYLSSISNTSSLLSDMVPTLPLSVDGILSELSSVTLSNEPTYTISSITSDRGGNYTCLVVNEAGFDISTTLLHVQPIFTTQPTDEFVTNGGMVTLQCEAESFPSPIYQWQRINVTTQMIMDLDNENNPTLVFNPVQYDDFGAYQCVVTANGTSVNATSNRAVITVSPEGSIDTDPPSLILSRMESGVFNCTALGGPNTTIFWIKGGSLNPSDVVDFPVNVTLALSMFDIVSDDSMLVLDYVNGTDGGDYTCIAINGAGVDNDTVTLFVRPEIITQPEDQFATVDDDVVFTCIADSFPPPEYRWQRFNTTADEFVSLPAEFGGNSSILTIAEVPFETFGNFHCIVTTPVINETITSDEVTLTISPETSVSIDPALEIVSNGSNTTFTCTADGGPNNTFFWTRTNDSSIVAAQNNPPLNISQILLSFSSAIISNGTTLDLTSINATEDGGVYYCIVANEAGVGVNQTLLYVQPAITQQPVDQYVLSTDRFNLSCVADSFPPPKYQWERMISGEFQELLNETNNFLEFDPVGFDGFGRYRCVATADGIEQNDTSMPALITVSPAGSIMVNPINQTVSRNTTVTFNCTAKGGPNTVYRWIKGSNPLMVMTLPLNLTETFEGLDVVSDDSMLVLDYVNGTDGGDYICIAINGAGFDNDTVTLFVRPEIITQPQNQLVKVGDSVTLTCIADSFPPPTYQWQRKNEFGIFENIPGETSFILRFDSISHEDFGTYRCVVRTPIINLYVNSTDALITVSPNGSVTVDPSFIIVDNGRDITFTCSAAGGPDNTFIWLRPDDLDQLTADGSNITQFLSSDPFPLQSVFNELSSISLSNETTLTLSSVNASEDGGRYSCYVLNSAGFQANETLLYVRPLIVEQPQDEFVENQDSVMLSCRADSFPFPSYRWEFMNRTTKMFEAIDGQNGTILDLSPIDFNEFGMYRCVASSEGIPENDTSQPALITVSPAGSIMVNPINQTVSRNTTVTFNCAAEGGPNTVYRWIKGSNPLMVMTPPLNLTETFEGLDVVSDDSMLVLDYVNGTDGGDYTCIAINEAGFDNDTVTLFVRPEIITQPEEQLFVEAGDSVTLTCIADSFPPPTYQWQRMNISMNEMFAFEELRGETSTTFTISSILHEEFGNYRCVVSTSIINEVVNSTAALITVSPNNSVTVSPPATTVDNGSLVNFTCSAAGGPDNMLIWVRSTSLSQVAAIIMPLLAELPLKTDYIINDISSSIIRNGSILTIPSVNATQDGGDYSCLVINEAGIGFDSTVLFVRPTITQHPDDVNTIVNATVTLSCLADAFPAPSYIWEFFNTTTNTFENVLNSNDSVLTFSSINYEDNGEYRCVATSYGEVIENATSTTAVITVSPLGSVFITPQTNNSFNGSLVTLTCSARGGPSNTFTWTYLRTEEVVSNQSVYEFVSDVSTGGDYQCSVQNEAGSDNNTATVNVGPIITIDPVSTNVTIDIANITLTCEAIGVPVPVIIWTHNETIILNANGETGIFDNNALIVEVDNTTLGTIRSTLTIFIALANNTGDYTCNATSPVDFYESVISEVALVLVQAVPDEPINLTATNVTSRNLTLSWVEPHDNNAPISGYYIFYNLPDFSGSNEVTLKTGTSEMLFIDDLHPGETYNFTVIAFNEEGNSSRSLPLSVLMLEEVPSGFPQDLNSTTINDTAILVSWASVPPSEANGIITGYTISITTDVSFVEEFENAIEDADTFDFLFTGLEEYVNYTFSISASTSIGPGPLSPSVISLTNEAIPAAPPQNFTVSDTTPNDISLSWDTPPIQDINGVIDNYIIRYKIIEQLGISINPDTSNVENVSVNGTDTMETLSQLGNYTVYEISISAVTIGEGPNTTIIQRTDENVPGAPPTSLEVVTNSTTSINITWTEPPLNMTYGIIILYEIQYGEYNDTTGTLKDGTTKDGTTLIAQVNTTDNATFSMEFDGLQEARTYGFQVRAYTVGPGPYTDIIINTTFPAPPDVAPANVTAPPPDEIEPTSVTLSWDPIPIDQQNGDLIYNVSINVLEPLNETPTRQKRQTGTPLSGNSLGQCLMAANISNSFNILVPGSMTSVTLNDIAPFVNYSFTVTGVTSVGSGPTSNPVNFSTPQGTAEAPQTLTVTNTSSTILNVTWDVPICDNGVRTGYVITYEAFPHPLDTYQINQTNIRLNNPDISQRNIEGLTPNTVYQVSICAENQALPRRCGLNITMNESTSEDAPEQVTEFALSNPTSPQVIANWMLPSARFGTFQLRLTYTGRQDFFYPSRPDRTQSVPASESILSGDVTSFNIENALPFANYTVMIKAFNDKVPIGAIQSRGVVVIDTILTLPTASSAVVDFTATTQSYTSIFLSWVVPLSPNGIITHYTVRYTNIMTGAQDHANTTDLHHIFDNLESRADYHLTVQPVTIFNDITYIGEISNTVRVSLNTSDHDVFPFPSPSILGTFDITVRLPRPESFGEGPLLFYGVIIAKNFPPNSSVDLQQQYPNPGPYRESASYYITAAWNRDVPESLKIGDDMTTTARTVDGVDTPYRNKGLDRRTEYSVLAIVYLDSGVPGEELVRYARIIQVVTTELGYNEGALGFFMSAIILGIIIGIIVIIVLILLILKKKNKGFYSFMKKEYEENEMSTIARGKPEAGIVIVNPPFAGTEPVNGTYVDISSKEAISVEEFPAHVAKMHSNDDYLFSVEYPSIEPQHHPTTEATSHPDNAIKNRYANITAYDHSRVKLREIPNIPGSDYINANFIDGFQEKNAYIASQGPVPHSIADFWRMIWEQNTAIIVMLTNLEEKGRIKCHLYWPPPDKKVSVQGQIRIELQEELSLTDYTIRTFTLQHKNSPDERTIKQFHFTSWPDFGVPEHPTSLLRFIHKVASTNPDDAGPIVVHCSAGVGRTGTFVTISTQIQRINTNKNLDIYNFVQAMRFRRCFMVQTEPQYIFIHDALLEYLECGETEVAAREFKDQYHRLLNSMSQEEGKSCLEFEFDNIQETIHKEPIVFAGTQTFNRPKNRYANVMPFDKTRCKLSTVPGIDGSDYINANFIEGYHKGKAFIATQGPLPDTIDDFWRMIWEHKCTSIVMLANEREGAKVMCHKYWPDNGSQMYGSYEVTLYSHKEYPDYVLREFKIVDSRDPEGSSQHIKQFQYVSWPSKGVPLSAIGLLDLREQVEKWQRTSGDKPIVVHCSGGCGRTGTYISICLLVDRLKSEGLVDVFQTVRALRLQRPGMVRSVEQYDFCYKSVLEYLGSFDTYANFSL